ncbi:aroma-sacti cluster domain-containing protein [Streptomyces sp. NPDC060198]|uniref:aroma-sacti cluster domain-containing protein n=1 Tax=Streptomyces sp. NPDC060198 TaxID=3347070 RepID=UPI003662B6FF
MTDRQHVLHRLREAGFSLDAFTEEQQEVLEELGPDELSLLLDIKSRLDEAGPDVQAHAEIAGGALF